MRTNNVKLRAFA